LFSSKPSKRNGSFVVTFSLLRTDGTMAQQLTHYSLQAVFFLLRKHGTNSRLPIFVFSCRLGAVESRSNPVAVVDFASSLK